MNQSPRHWFSARLLLFCWLILGICSFALPGMVPLASAQIDNAPANFEGRTIADIRITNNQRVATSRILAAISSQPGQPYDSKQINEDLKAVQKLRGIQAVFVSAVIEPQGLVVVFDVLEDRVLNAVEIQGNRKFSLKDLKKIMPVRAGDFADHYLLSRGSEVLASHYRQAGYHRVHITVDATLLASEGKVIYRIVEGPRTRVRQIKFQGNDKISSKKLRGNVGSKPHVMIFSPGNYDPEQVEKDVTELRLFLRDQGYLDAQVGLRPPEFSDDQKWVTLTFLIGEGPLFKVRDVRFQGNSDIPDAELAKTLKVGPGDVPFQKHIGVTNTRNILEAYGRQGYADAQVRLSPIYSKEEPGVIDLVYNIEEGQQYVVGRIDVFGNETTQDRVIRRQFKLAPGDILDVTKLQESRRRLLESTLFTQVDVSDVPGQDNMRDIKVNVTEGPTAMLIAGVGLTSDAGVVGDFRFEQRNFDLFDFPTSIADFFAGESFHGAGQYLLLQAQPGSEFSSFVVTFREPYIADLPLSFTQSIYLRGRLFDDYDEQRLGGLWSLGYRFAEQWEIEGSINLQEITIDNVDDDTAPEIIASTGSHNLTSVKGTLVRDTTNSVFLPTSGDLFEISYEQTGLLGGDYDFGRLQTRYSAFFTTHMDSLDRPSVLALRARFGTIFGNAPYFERFYAGGISTLRGFDYRGVSPRVSSVIPPGDDIAVGSDWIFLAGAEYSFPLIGNDLRGAAFVDSGTVEDGPYRVSLGVSIRLMMPFFAPVPLSADFAWPISMDDNDETRVFSFSFASIFR